MKYFSAAPNSCDWFSFGEVENYLIEPLDPSGVYTGLVTDAQSRQLQLPSNESKIPNTVTISPNPSHDIACISYTYDRDIPNEVLIYNNNGKLMLSIPNHSLSNDISFDVSHFPSGVYRVSSLVSDELYSTSFMVFR